MTVTQPIFKTTCMAGGVFLLAGGVLGWLTAPLTGWLRGYSLVPFKDLPDGPAVIHFLSFGCTASILGAAGILFFRVERVRWIVGILALALGIAFFYHLAFLNPRWFWTLLDQDRQYQKIFSFSMRYLPLNPGREPIFQANLSGDNLVSRITTSAYFLGLGWWLEMAGAAVLIATTRSSRWVAALVLLLGALAVIPFWRADHLRQRGDAALVRGESAKAVRDYLDSARMDSYMKFNIDFRVHRGQAYDQLGRRDEADWHFYQADRLQREGRTPDALFEFEKAFETGAGSSRRVARTELAGLEILYGLQQFESGNKEKSLLFFRKAIQVDPSQIQADYYVAKAYFDLGRYPEAIRANVRVLDSVRNPIVLANVQANIGDCYYRQGQFAEAKRYYTRSMQLDRHLNVRALKSLVGP